ncbi:MAG: hypothetical protein HYU63_05210 [Armatimonadetes bacterium]|nr:hypothetical protein [Armatimonadota bacterium]
MRLKAFLIILTLIFSIFAVYAVTSATLQAKLINEEGALKLIAAGEVKDGDAWLGVSLYPKGFKDAIKDGDHKTYILAKGKFNKDFVIPEKYYGGTYEIAVWNRKVYDKSAWSQKNGYRLDGLLAYRTGMISK